MTKHDPNTTIISDQNETFAGSGPLPQFNPPPDIDETGRSRPDDRRHFFSLTSGQLTAIWLMAWALLTAVAKFAIGLSWLAAIGYPFAMLVVISIAFFAAIAIRH
jgi:hypothetical protein